MWPSDYNSTLRVQYANTESLIQAIFSVQAFVTGEELSSAMAFIVFAQSLGPAISLSLCNLLFVASLKSQLSQQAPNVDAAAVIKAGATGFRAIVQPSNLPGVLTAYANSVDRTFYLVAALAASCGIVLWGMGWRDLRKGNSTATDEGEKSLKHDKTLENDPVDNKNLEA
jgi:hypothetical protein